MQLHLSTELMDEVITEALQHVNRRKADHEIFAVPSEDFFLVKIDARLIMQVIINIVDNAMKYTPARFPDYHICQAAGKLCGGGYCRQWKGAF